MWNEFLTPKRIGHRGQVLVVSTILPGMALLIEFLLLTLPSDAYGSLSKLLSFVTDATNEVSVFGGLIILAGATLLGLTVGVVSRFLLFSIVDWVDRLHWSKWRIPTADVVRVLTDVYGSDSIEKFLKRHPIGSVLAAQKRAGALDRDRPPLQLNGSAADLTDADDSSDEWKSLLGRRQASLDTWRGYVFSYAKHRLRATHPALSVDYFEIEINLLFGLIPALVLLIAVVIRWVFESGLSVVSAIVAIAVSTALIALAIRSSWRSARESKIKEHERALRYLFFSDWIQSPSGDAPTDDASS